LLTIMAAFDEKYAAYAEFQSKMERFWCLRWLAQSRLQRVDAVVIRDDLVRLAHAPLYLRLVDCPPLAPGRRIVVDIFELDDIDLTLRAGFVAMAPEPVDAAADDLELAAAF